MIETSQYVYEIHYAYDCPFCKHRHHTLREEDFEEETECDICFKKFKLRHIQKQIKA